MWLVIALTLCCLICLQVVWGRWSDLYCSPGGPMCDWWLLWPCVYDLFAGGMGLWSDFCCSPGGPIVWSVTALTLCCLICLQVVLGRWSDLFCSPIVWSVTACPVLFDLFTGGTGALVWPLLFSYCVIGDCLNPVLFDLFTGGTGALDWPLLFSWWSSYNCWGWSLEPAARIQTRVPQTEDVWGRLRGTCSWRKSLTLHLIWLLC